MSKIEKALQKARSMGMLRGRVPTEGTALQPLVPTQVAARKADNVEDVLAAANKQLARMGDSWFLTEVERADNRIIYPAMKDEHVANAFRDLRTKILEKAGNRNCSVLVCGVTEACGASFVALNLAVAFSLDESRTALLVDCDIGSPGYDSLLRKDRERFGITDFFERDDVRIEQIIHPVGIRKLRLIPAGIERRGAVEYFTSRKVRTLLKAAQQRYPDRYVIINAPPVADSADTRILASLADLVLLVVAYGSTTEPQILNAARIVKPDKLLGIVFNDDPQIPRFNWKDALRQGVKRLFHAIIPRKKQAGPEG